MERIKATTIRDEEEGQQILKDDQYLKKSMLYLEWRVLPVPCFLGSPVSLTPSQYLTSKCGDRTVSHSLACTLSCVFD